MRALPSEVAGAGVDELHDVDVAHVEGGFAVAEVAVPFADEAIVETKGLDLGEAAITARTIFGIWINHR